VTLDYNWVVSGTAGQISRKGPQVRQFFTAWPHMSLISVIDILLVAFVIYELLVLIKGTRAAYMLVGVAVLAISFYFSGAGELTTLNWLISTLLPYAVFALIVIFSAEIRQALAGLGRRLLLSRAAASEADAYDDIVLAANLFSQNQTGALIVIEREIGLRTYIESGVPLDARLSYDLLATIFRPSAPLHDGAVIVQKDRIAAAACFLPLSMNPVLSTQLGTRHRAGIGVTEETDAIAVIVSEETGAISLAVGGKIERDVTVEELRERLGALLSRYLPPSTLPTAITNGSEEAASPDEGSQSVPLPRTADSRLGPGSTG
jgi:diadenylate cyclase